MLTQYLRAGYRTNSLRALLTSRLSAQSNVHPTVKLMDSIVVGPAKIAEGVVCYGATISGNVSIDRHTYLSGPGIYMLAALNPITIGAFCSIARGVQIQEYNHVTDRLTTSFLSRRLNPNAGISREEITSKGPIEIGHDVWIGSQAIITSGIQIGTGAIIGAAAVVTHDVPAYAIVAGNPARIIRYRIKSEAARNQLIDSQWWTRDLKSISQLYADFSL